MGPDGELEPLDEDSLAEVVDALREAEVEAVAVCLLFAFLHPEHEQRVGDAVREALPDAHVSLSSAVLPEVREYERMSTTVADAYLAPRLASYLRALAERTGDAGLPAPAGHAVLRRRRGSRGRRRARGELRAVGARGRRRRCRLRGRARAATRTS